jgi:hypothetical protein
MTRLLKTAIVLILGLASLTGCWTRGLDCEAIEFDPSLGLQYDPLQMKADGDVATWTTLDGQLVGYAHYEDTTIWNMKECVGRG